MARMTDVEVEHAAEVAFDQATRVTQDEAARLMVEQLPQRVLLELADLLYVEHPGRKTTRVTREVYEAIRS